MSEILETNNLSLNIDGNEILNEVNLELKEGKIQALVGPNGAGKSSLAFSIMGLEGYRDIEGDILFREESIKKSSVSERAKKGIALAWQEPARYEGLKVKKFIEAASKENGEEKARDALEKVGMDPEDYLDRALDSGLSGGERKKIELASILVMNPDLVLLDEPDSGIDVASLEKIFEGIQYLKEEEATVVLITHSATALEQAEYAYLMCCGSVVDQGRTEEIGRYFEEKCISCNHKNEPSLKDEV